MKTKIRILYITLELLSRSGYDGVSMRDIAAGVGIKESSLYKHYSNKQGIFDCLLQEMDTQFRQAMDGLNFASACGTIAPPVARTPSQRMEELSALCTGLFYYLINDEYAGKFRSVLTVEQFRSEQAAQMYQDHFFNLPLSLYADVFRALLQRGEIPYADADFLALEFYAPVYMLLCRCGANTALAQSAAEVLSEHIAEFGRRYCRA